MNRFLSRIPAVALVLFLVAAPWPAAVSAPLSFVPQTVVQPDGSVLHCFASGDEYYSWMHDADGYTIVQDQRTGYYVYATLRDARLEPTAYRPGASNPAALGMTKWLRDDPSVYQGGALLAKGGPRRTIIAGPTPTKGIINNVVVFIRFSGEAEYTDSIMTYNAMFNAATGSSMLAYFREVSYTTLTVSSTFYPAPAAGKIVSFQDTHPRSYYMPYSTSNPDGYQTDRDAREHTLLQNASAAVSAQVPDTLDIDTDDDGYVDNVCFVVSGSPTAWSTLLWPHMWSLDSRVAMIGNSRVGRYNFQLESSLSGSGVGVLCHEMFHSLGAPDLYHYSYDGISPAGRWDIMESNSNPPQHMLQHMKYAYGKWIASVPEITAPGTYTLQPSTSPTNSCFRIKSPYSSTEYFMVEYRRRTGVFEAQLPGDGLLVYRINSVLHGNASGPPDEVYIYRPNGTLKANGTIDQAYFSSTSGRTRINDLTNPSSFLSTGKKGGLNISNVTLAGATISFTIGLDTQQVLLTSPARNAQWQTGSQKRIAWMTFGVQRNMRVEYTVDSGATWSVIAPSAVTSWYWTVPDAPSRFCRMRVVDVANNAVRDSASFVISMPFYRSQFNFDVTDTTKARDHAGIVFLDTAFWTSRSGSDLLYSWNRNGEVTQEFSIMGAAAIKAMTYDGRYVYAATGSDRLPRIDPYLMTRLDLIKASLKATYLAFDPTVDNGAGGLWIGDTTNTFALIDLKGNEIRRMMPEAHGITGVTGMAYDGHTAGGPYLWVFSRGEGAGTPQYLYRLQLPSGVPTRMFHDVLQDIGSTLVDGLAGGLAIAYGVVPGTVSLCGTLLGTPNRLFGYEFPDSSTALLVEENFVYTPDSAIARGPWKAIAGEGNFPVRVQPQGLFYDGYASSNKGRSVQLSGSSYAREDVAIRTAARNSGDLYLAMLVRVDSADLAPSAFAALLPDAAAGNPACTMHVKRAADGRIAFGVSRGSDTAGMAFTAANYAQGATQLLALRYSFNPGASDDSVALWVNPPFTVAVPAGAVIAGGSAADVPYAGAVALLQGRTPTFRMIADGIRVATGWDKAVMPGLPFQSKSILIVDETDESMEPFAGMMVSDSAVDAFYTRVFPPSATWDVAALGSPGRALLAKHQLVVWHADHRPKNGPGVFSRPDVVDLLQEYIDNGGALLLTGWDVMESFNYGAAWPIRFQAGTFAYDYLHVAEVNIAADSGFARAAGTTPFPDLAVDAARLPASYNGKLDRILLFQSRVDSTAVLYRYDLSASDPAHRGVPCGIRAVEPLIETAVLGFPLSFLREADVRRFAEEYLRLLGVTPTPTGVDAPVPLRSGAFALQQNYPNPFAAETSIPYALAAESRVTIEVYDAMGRRMRVLRDAIDPAGAHTLRWRADGLRGVYFLRLTVLPTDGSKGGDAIRRAVILR